MEVEGPFHGAEKSGKRTEYLENLGYCVLRFNDNTVREDPKGVARIIKREYLKYAKDSLINFGFFMKRVEKPLVTL